MIDLAVVRLTRQKVNAGIWICAGLTMVASAISGVTAFYYLQKDGWGIASGAMTALAVDVALWVVLTGDRLMEALGIAAGPWARAVRWGTAAMSVTLNTTAAGVANIPIAAKAPLVVLHIFVPLIMVGLAELRGEYARELAPKEREALEGEEARRKVPDTPIAAPSERISGEIREETTRSTPVTGPTDWRPAASGVAPAIATVPPVPAPPPVRNVTQLVPRQRPVSTGNTPVTDRIIDYLNRHCSDNPYGITAETLAQKTRQNNHTCKKVLTEWRKTQIKPQRKAMS